MSNNGDLLGTRTSKKDEFYTQLSDIENELRHYPKHFKNKTILCNCDDPSISNFFKYFSLNFEKLKKLITICYKNQQMDLFSQNDPNVPSIQSIMGTKMTIVSLTLMKLENTILNQTGIFAIMNA